MPFVPILTAPTAAGKSALAVDAAAALPAGRVEIVAADAFTVYRGLDLGTAKPTAAERRGVPHHLLDVVDVTEPYDVARFVAEAEATIGAVLARGNVPLVVGGTGFYLRALCRGLPTTPPADVLVRADVERDLAERGLDSLLAEIAAVDPAEERRMERNPRRVVRAVELLRRTGRLPGHYPLRPPAFAYDVIAYARPAADAEARIAARTLAMLRAGWPQEAAWLAATVDPDAAPHPTVWQALGYRDALAVHRGQLGREAAAERIALATRQYVKRQATFIRTQLGAPLDTPDGAARRLAAVLAALAGAV
ncbi:tRNA dimethylallyltransferase [Deinococcus metalli]|uniref:tRNA dimethylallyltransferase n=1 Tax=Deinococcus metalli TaxID=1141878 RepID=A0A7W8KBR2_9DEIO|nr:tRNA dimethylallyltransferase [Deinococcus metalli]